MEESAGRGLGGGATPAARMARLSTFKTLKTGSPPGF
jgi:hypothetical protein